jgi:hypothetical protein
MKKTILVMVLAGLMMTTGCNQILQISIVLPSFLEAYYEWLITFPGMQTPEPVEPAPTEIWSKRNASTKINQIANDFDDILDKLSDI